MKIGIGTVLLGTAFVIYAVLMYRLAEVLGRV